MKKFKCFLLAVTIFLSNLAQGVEIKGNIEIPDAVFIYEAIFYDDYQLMVTLEKDSTLTAPELATHFFSNLIRLGYDCGNSNLVCGGKDTLSMLHLNLNLATSASWFAKHLHDVGCFQHETCCDLEYDQDNEVACIEGTEGTSYKGTSWTQRCSMFFASCTGENIAAGNYAASATICQWLNSPGHRSNMCSSSFNSLGTGVYLGSKNYRYYWVQNFGGSSGQGRLRPGAIFDGAAIGLSSTASGVIVSSPTSKAKNVIVEINGTPFGMDLKMGTGSRGAYTANVSISLCDRYRFHAEFEDSVKETIPSTGYYIYRNNKEECDISEEYPYPDEDFFADDDQEEKDVEIFDDIDDHDESPDISLVLPDFDPGEKADAEQEETQDDGSVFNDFYKEEEESSSGCSCNIVPF